MHRFGTKDGMGARRVTWACTGVFPGSRGRPWSRGRPVVPIGPVVVQLHRGRPIGVPVVDQLHPWSSNGTHVPVVVQWYPWSSNGTRSRPVVPVVVQWYSGTRGRPIGARGRPIGVPVVDHGHDLAWWSTMGTI